MYMCVVEFEAVGSLGWRHNFKSVLLTHWAKMVDRRVFGFVDDR